MEFHRSCELLGGGGSIISSSEDSWKSYSSSSSEKSESILEKSFLKIHRSYSNFISSFWEVIFCFFFNFSLPINFRFSFACFRPFIVWDCKSVDFELFSFALIRFRSLASKILWNIKWKISIVVRQSSTVSLLVDWISLSRITKAIVSRSGTPACRWLDFVRLIL